MKSSPTLAASAAALAVAVGASFGAASVVIAQGPLVAPSQDLSNAPAPALAPTVHQQALAAAPIPRIELWRGAKLGMTLDEVKALFPNGHGATPLPGANAPPAEDDGTEALWQMNDQVYGRVGVATFFFRSGGLTSVTVNLSDIKPHATIGNMADAKALETAFSGYYGKPTVCLESTARGLDQVDCRWQGHGLRIGLSYQDFGGASPSMAIAIRPVTPPPVAKSPFFGKRARKARPAS